MPVGEGDGAVRSDLSRGAAEAGALQPGHVAAEGEAGGAGGRAPQARRGHQADRGLEAAVRGEDGGAREAGQRD